MPDSKSYVRILKDQLSSIDDRMEEILKSGSLERYSKSQSPWLSISSKGMPPQKISYRWSTLEPRLERDLNRLVKEYQEWAKEFDLLFSDETKIKKREIQKIHAAMYLWLTSRTGLGKPSSVQQAVVLFKEDVRCLYACLDELEKDINNQALIVVDSNALIDCPKLESYIDLVAGNSCEVIIVSTVLAELDHLKTVRSDKRLVQKVREVIRMLKGLKERGDILSGVELTEHVSVRMIPTEPMFVSLPDWLDPSNDDDRILATVLEIQRDNPGNSVIVVSNDLNMQNKASFASLPVVEVEECWGDPA